MRTDTAHLRKGVAARILAHIIAVARSRSYTHLYLETGPVAAFAPARALYERHGFTYCGPFADYVEDPYSVFMCLDL
jgi:putative acetyltransferase